VRLGEAVSSEGLLEERGILFIEQAKDAPEPRLDNPCLRLVNSRKMGAAALHQYQKMEAE
jgi:hypothetical protein